MAGARRLAQEPATILPLYRRVSGTPRCESLASGKETGPAPHGLCRACPARASGFSGESFSAGIVDLAERHRTYSTCRRLSPGMGQPPAPIEIAFLCSF